MTTERERNDPTRALLSETFSAWIAEAPPAPDEIGPPRPAARAPARTAAFALALAAGLAALAFFLAPFRRAEATPLALLRRAMAFVDSHRVARFRLSVEAPPIEAASTLAGGTEGRASWILTVARPGRFLQEVDREAAGAEHAAPIVTGCDGAMVWEYDERKGRVEVAPLAGIEGGGSFDFAHEVTFGLARRLLSSDRYEVEERTGPADRARGRRRFFVRPLDPGETWRDADVEIDAATGRLLRHRVRWKAGPLALLVLDLELTELDPPLPAGFFHWRAHVPPDAPVVEQAPALERPEAPDDGR